jgi:hypothetical protein
MVTTSGSGRPDAGPAVDDDAGPDLGQHASPDTDRADPGSNDQGARELSDRGTGSGAVSTGDVSTGGVRTPHLTTGGPYADADAAEVTGPSPSPSPRSASGPSGPSEARQSGWTLGRWLGIAAFVALGIGLFFAYLLQARTATATSESAGQALQAWDMLHGNPILRGWTLSDVSFYTTELPEYMLVEVTRGLNADTVHVAAALSYTLIVMLGGLLAKGRATGKEGLIRFLIAAGIMLAPPLNGTALLLASPDHVGTHVPLLLIWLVVDRAPARWWKPLAVAVLLTWGQVADALVLYEAAVPLAVACAIRMYRRRGPLSGQWNDFALAVGAVASAGATKWILSSIRQAGGFRVKTPIAAFQTPAAMAADIWTELQHVLDVFGADFFGLNFGGAAIVALIHLVGVVLVAAAVVTGARRLYRETDLLVQVLTIAFVVVLAAYLFGTKQDANEIVGLLPIGAVLAGRLLTGRLTRDGLVPALSVVLVCYAGFLVGTAAQPAAPPSPQQALATWLRAHHLTYGMAGFWNASAVTVASGGHVQVRPVLSLNHQIATTLSESDASWYRPRLHDANFAIASKFRYCEGSCLTRADLRRNYGPPAATYQFDSYYVLVWNKNLLRNLPTYYWCGNVWPWNTPTTPTLTPCSAT